MKTDINLQTKVASLLESYPELEDILMELSPVFSKLKNPVLRRTIAKVTSLQQAAGVAGISPPLLIQKLRKAAGLSEIAMNADTDNIEDAAAPFWFDESKISFRFDDRPVIESGESPMQEILKLSSKLEGEQILQIVTPFKPIPIIDILKSRGFKVWSKGNDHFFVKE